jgi:hypothetical protein
MRMTIDIAILIATWLAIGPIRLRMPSGGMGPSWTNHVIWGAVLVGVWIMLTRLDPWLRHRSTSRLSVLIPRLLGPVTIVAFLPSIAYGFNLRHAVPISLLILWLLPVLVLLTFTRVVAGGGAEAACPPRSREARVGLWSLGLGLALLSTVPLIPDIRYVFVVHTGDFLISLIRGGVQLAGLSGVAVALGLAFTDPIIRMRKRLLTLRLGAFLAITAGFTLALAAAFAYFVLGHMPHIQDEVAMLFQARNFAAGRLYAKTPEMIEAFDMEFVVADGGKWYGKYFPGPSLLFVPGVWIKAPWLINPALSFAAVLLLFATLRRLIGERASRFAVLLAVVSPFWIYTFGSSMSHGGCLVLMLVFGLMILAATGANGRWYHGLMAGLALGLGAWFRPYTAAALSLPWMIYAMVRVVRRPAVALIIPWFILSVVAATAPLLAYNKALTGSAFLTPFTRSDPKDHVGFGKDVGIQYVRKDRRGHDPAKGAFNTGLMLDGLGRDLLGGPRGILLLGLIGGLAAGRSRKGYLMLAVGAVLPAAYFFYWFANDLGYGPRYYSEALPAYLGLAALGLIWLRHLLYRMLKGQGLNRPARPATAAVWGLAALMTIGCLCAVVPDALGFYGIGFGATDPAVRNTIERQRPRNAVVFVLSAHYASTRGGQFAPDYYNAAFWMNSPTLDDDVIFVRDLDRDPDRSFPPGSNQAVLAHFPGRQAFRFVSDGPETGHLIPLPPPSTAPSEQAPRPASTPRKHR